MMKALMVSSFLVVLATGVWGSPCPPFSCGELRNISYPFRLLGGPPECGLKAYELTCSGLKATIKINTGQNRSYGDIVKLIRKGFPVLFPTDVVPHTNSQILRTCLTYSISYFDNGVGISTFLCSVVGFAMCVHDYSEQNKLFWVVTAIISFIEVFKYIIALALLSRFFFVPLVVWTFLAQKFWKTKISIDAVEKFLRMRHDFGPTRFDYTDIIAITSHFRDKLGQGGYGSVFKGVLLPGRVHVAIKMLEGNSSCNGEDFISEVSTIGRIHHVNVVRLVGFCSEEMRRALVYEYMPGGSLDKYIFSTEKSFPWDKLNEIALGIARGMNYLHQGCEMQILHFDIKPHNILLDSNFVPKVADFGLAKLYPRDNSFVPSNALRGTVGYIAPEMISRSFGAISSKSDVYSFGMLLLEMAGGRRNADPNAANSSQSYYPSWVYDKLTAQEVDAISPVAGMHELERKLCIVGLWCIQMKSHDRPTMSEVIDMLEGGFDGLQMPSRPFFCDDDHTAVPDSYPLLSELTEISEEDE
ncbi:rust resistance kinase Lr10-like isoform X2 [Hordeum vulgare subsp. vulgare]|uniref:rust resistance kinase Lr10-like isoform X2 n=1 Tax=Hordeum vulgare subsp. vulgare TaxID=112509 RepID=UPI001B84A2E2|nr:rust resistance kinase Lr10-like isoform X2 [Hordeum vulgare subsp. vulgare]